MTLCVASLRAKQYYTYSRTILWHGIVNGITVTSCGGQGTLHEWSFYMKFIRRAFGEFHIFHVKWPRVKDSVYHMSLSNRILSPSI